MVWWHDIGSKDAVDEELIRYCAMQHYVLVTQDEGQRRDEYLVSEIAQAKIGFIEVRFRKGSFERKDHLYRQYMGSICELVRHPTPFCAQLNASGFQFAPLEAKLWSKGHGRRATAKA